MPLVTIWGDNGPQQVWQNDDGTYWAPPENSSGTTEDSIRPDLRDAWRQQNLARVADYYQRAGYQQFTPAQVQAFQSSGVKPNADSPNLNPAFGPNLGLYNDSMYGGNNLWYGPQAGPQHTDNGSPLSFESILTGGINNARSEATQSDWNNMRSGLAVMAMPLAGYGITAGLAGAGIGATAVGAEGAAAGSGAVAGGTAAGTVGVDASTGLYAGESAAGTGSSGIGLGGTGGGATSGAISGGAGSGSLIGGAGSDTAAATGETGAFDTGASQGVFDSAGNPLYQDPSMLQYAQAYGSQAMDLAKQLGVTPASALSMIVKGLGRAAPGIVGAVAAKQQQGDFQRLSDQYSGYGAPYRERLANLYADPSSFLKSAEVTAPIQQASDIAAHSLSTGGNPIASGNSLQQLQDFSANQLFSRLGQEKDRLAGFGGLTAYNAAAPAAATNAINAGSNVFNALGASASNVFNPPQTLAQQMAEFHRLSSGGVSP